MNDITVTKGSTEWDVEYTADQAATVTKTMETGGTVLDRDIHIEVTVPTGTEGTPVATKGTVSGNAVSVTPSVTNTGGFISGNTLTGTPVSVSASELVSGTKNITAAGTTDVTNYASASVSAGTAGTPTATKGTVSGNTVSVTPSVTNTAGFIAGGTLTGTPVSVSASELVSGTKSITASGTTDVTNYASASVAAGSASTPDTTITANPTISVSSGGLITATVSKTQNVTPTVNAGYITSGNNGKITITGSNTNQLTAKAAQTYTPTTTNQSISSGQYLTGAQTILGDANLIPANIAKDVSIFGVTGTHEGGGGGGVTTVSFGDDAVFAGKYIGYVDGNGDYQYTTQLAMLDAPNYQMLTGSIVSVVSEPNSQVGTFSGLTLVDSKQLYTTTRPPATYYLSAYQVG